MKTIKLYAFTILHLLNAYNIFAQETSTFTDTRDGESYETVKIGEQWWMAENLNYKTDTGSMCYDNNNEYCEKYGRLYNWETSLNVCPEGWHLPDTTEWMQLFYYVDKKNGPFKEKYDNIWAEMAKYLKHTYSWENNNNGINGIGFNALATGCINYSGSSSSMGSYASWWSSKENKDNCAWIFDLQGYNCVTTSYTLKAHKFTVRCVKN